MQIQAPNQSVLQKLPQGGQVQVQQKILYEFKCGQNFKLLFHFKSIKLHLYRSFNTAHSSTSTRTNFFVKLTLFVEQKQQTQSFYGAGEAGLPPKKPKCYLADLDSCFLFAKQYERQIFQKTHEIKNAKSTFIDQFSFGEKYFKRLLNSNYADVFCFLIAKIHNFQNPTFRAARSALQFAIFDLWSNYEGITLHEGIFSGQKQASQQTIKQKYGFYTVSYEDHQKMIQNGLDSKKITDFIKIKYVNNPKELIQLLKLFHQKQIGAKWIIDLNSSWNPEQWRQFYTLLTGQSNKEILLPKISYVQQPFMIQLSQEHQKQWAKIKQQTVVKIIADQSFSVFEDIEKIQALCHGVNIKNQKTGGLINSLKAAISCKNKKIDIMFGSMVSTQLGSSQCFQIRNFSNFYDADGALLVKSPKFEGGFQWKQGGLLSPCTQNKGIGFSVQFYRTFL